MTRPQNKHLLRGGSPGRTPGSRNRFSESMVSDFLADWETHGSGVLERVRLTDPAAYLRVAAALVPKELAVSVEQRSGPMDSEEGRYLRRLVDIIAACAGDSDPMLVLEMIEQDLRARLAAPIEPSNEPD